MIRRMRGVSLKDRRRSADLLMLMGISVVEEIMNRSGFRWLGNVEGDLDWVSLCRQIEVEVEVCIGGKMNTSGGRMDRVMKNRGLRVEMAADRDAWIERGALSRLTRLRIYLDAGRKYIFCESSRKRL